MPLDQLASVLWRRRRAFLITAAVCIAVVVAVTLSLPKTYKATATLLVGTKNSLVTTDLLDQITRTYATLAANPNVAQEVAQSLPEPHGRCPASSRALYVIYASLRARMHISTA